MHSRYAIFPGISVGTGKIRKRLWRIIAAKKYCEWRKEGRPFCILTKREFGQFRNGQFQVEGSIFSPQAAVMSYRSYENRGNYHPPHKDQAWIEMSRKWQLKNRLNYGRY